MYVHIEAAEMSLRSLSHCRIFNLKKCLKCKRWLFIYNFSDTSSKNSTFEKRS